MAAPELKTFYTDTERTRLFYAQRYVRQMRACADYAALNPLECQANTELVKAAVSRGDYENVVKLIVAGDKRLYSITGPTGCGKSTFAILEMILGSTCLIVCPSPANMANILVEFSQRIPDTSIKNGLNALTPTVACCDFETFCDPDAQLTVCTAEQFNGFVAKWQCFPPVDYLVLDEYHLNNPPVITARMTLRYCFPGRESPQRKQKVVFVSATPPDEEPPPARTEGLTIQKVEVPDPLVEPVPDIYRLAKHPPYSNKVMLVVVDSCSAAHTLSSRLNSLGEATFSLCKCPTAEEVSKQLMLNTYNFTFIATPDTEAGITVPCSIMVNPGLSARVEFVRGVCTPDVFPLGPRANEQRLGRAGRVGHTIVYIASHEVGKTDTASLVELAAGFLRITALTGGKARGHEPDLATARFARLLKVNPSAAKRASLATSPLLALYRADDRGRTYSEFGGRARTFVEDNALDFKLYKWPTGSAYAPFLDLCSEHDLTEGNSPGVQKAIADSIVARNPHVMDNVDFGKALSAAEAKPELYEGAIWGAMKQLNGPPGEITWEGSMDQDWTSIRNCELSYMLTEDGARAWSLLRSLGAKFKARAKSVGTNKEGKNKIELVREFHYRGEVVSFDPSPLLGSDKLVSPKKLEEIFLPFFTPVMATAALVNREEHSIDLVGFAHLKARCSNTWFKSIV